MPYYDRKLIWFLLSATGFTIGVRAAIGLDWEFAGIVGSGVAALLAARLDKWFWDEGVAVWTPVNELESFSGVVSTPAAVPIAGMIVGFLVLPIPFRMLSESLASAAFMVGLPLPFLVVIAYQVWDRDPSRLYIVKGQTRRHEARRDLTWRHEGQRFAGVAGLLGIAWFVSMFILLARAPQSSQGFYLTPTGPDAWAWGTAVSGFLLASAVLILNARTGRISSLDAAREAYRSLARGGYHLFDFRTFFSSRVGLAFNGALIGVYIGPWIGAYLELATWVG